MYTQPALFNPHLISCTLTCDSTDKTPLNPWRTVKWYELEYVLTGEGGGLLKSCQPVWLKFEPSALGYEGLKSFSYLAVHIKNVCNFDICLKVCMLFGERPFEAEPVRSSLYPEGSLHGVPQKAGRLRLPAGFSGWVAFRSEQRDRPAEDMHGLEMELMEPDGRNGAMLLLDRPFFSGTSRLCLPQKCFNITKENFGGLVDNAQEGVAIWLKQGGTYADWNGASINIAYNPRFQLARPGMVFFHRPGSRIKRINGYTGIKLIFDAVYDDELEGEYQKRVFEDADSMHLEKLAKKSRDFEALKKLERLSGSVEFEAKFKNIFESFAAGGRGLELKAQLLDLIAKLPSCGENSSFCVRIKERLDRDYGQNLSLIGLSEEEGVTPEHLCRSFKKAYGDSPVAYLIKVRLAHARRLLLSTDLSVDEIKEYCGFLSASYFYAAFKRSEGLAPGEYRNVFAGR